MDACESVCVCVALLPVDGRPHSMMMNHTKMHQQACQKEGLSSFVR